MRRVVPGVGQVMLAHGCPLLAVRHFQQFHRQQDAAVSALVPLVKRGSVVVLLAHAEAHEEAAPVVADGLPVIGAVAQALGLVLGHLGNEAAPAGIVDQGRSAPRRLLLVGLAFAGAALADVVQVQDRRPSAGRDVFQRGDKPRHVAVAVLVEAVNAAQGVQHDQPGIGAELHHAGKVPLVHDVQALAHDRL
jgi:hypothetical protein